MMRFKDFPVKIEKLPNWLNEHESEKMENTLLRINLWIEENELIVLNIETLILPSLVKHKERANAAIFISKGGESSTIWYQVFRVWYRKDASTKAPA